MKYSWSEYGVLPEQARRIREEVFVQEQGFCEEFDALDAQCWHLLLWQDGNAIGTARIFWEKNQRDMHIGRVAVCKHQRGGSGSLLLRACCEQARLLGAQRAILGAQCRAVGFYKKNGFQPYGELFDDEGCPHQMMEKIL